MENPNQKLRLIIGCYTVSLPHVTARGKGISFVDLDLDTGKFTHIATYEGLANPSYLSLDAKRGLLYAVEEMPASDGSSIVTAAVDIAGATLDTISREKTHGDWPCHIGFDRQRNRVFVSNYLDGSMTCWPLSLDGKPTGEATVIRRSGHGPNPDRQEGPHVHFALATVDDRHVLICDAGTDEIARYPLIGDSGIADQPDLVLSAPPGALPRHMAMSHDGNRLFVVSELGNIVSAYSATSEGFHLIGHASTLRDGSTGESAAAAIRCHPNGRFLYSSNRGDDSIAIFDISDPKVSPRLLNTCSSGGRTPREFAIDTSGQVMVVANQDSHNLRMLRISPDTGQLTLVDEGYETGSPVCVITAERLLNR